MPAGKEGVSKLEKGLGQLSVGHATECLGEKGKRSQGCLISDLHLRMVLVAVRRKVEKVRVEVGGCSRALAALLLV